MAFQSQSQAGQDEFVRKMLCPNLDYKGTFLEIGAGDPKDLNNTWALEKCCGWSGISVDIIDYSNVFEDERPLTTFVQLDMNDPTWFDTLKKHTGLQTPVTFDYLSFDLDDSGLEVLKTFPFDEMKFKVLTVEHDKYRLGPHIQKSMQEILLKNGYSLYAEDVKCPAHRARSPLDVPFEDWYINPDLINN